MNPEAERLKDAKTAPDWTTSKQRSSVKDIHLELDWLQTYLTEKDIFDSACWAHFTRLRSLIATHTSKPKTDRPPSPPMFYCETCQRRFFNKGWHAEACGSSDYDEL